MNGKIHQHLWNRFLLVPSIKQAKPRYVFSCFFSCRFSWVDGWLKRDEKHSYEKKGTNEPTRISWDGKYMEHMQWSSYFYMCRACGCDFSTQKYALKTVSWKSKTISRISPLKLVIMNPTTTMVPSLKLTAAYAPPLKKWMGLEYIRTFPLRMRPNFQGRSGCSC